MFNRATQFAGRLAPSLTTLGSYGCGEWALSSPFDVYRHGRKWLVTADDAAAGRFINETASQRLRAFVEGRPPIRLVALRSEFRVIAGRGRIAGLFRCLDCQTPETLRLALWLMGRCHNKRATRVVAEFRETFDNRVRREVARALRRLEAWPELRGMAWSDADARVRRLATAKPAAPFDQRLCRAAGSTLQTIQTAASGSQATLYVREPIGPGKPPKSAEWIRFILERIRRLVRGA